MEPDSTVLLVDDNENDSLFFQRAVTKSKFPVRVYWAKNGQEAKDYVMGVGVFADREEFPFPKLIVTDNQMPVMSGNDFLKWLKDHPQYNVVPTIVLGGSGLPDEVDHAYEELGVHSYIPKPANHEKLEQIVKLMFDYWSICLVPRCKI